jgi:hypothetical protein
VPLLVPLLGQQVQVTDRAPAVNFGLLFGCMPLAAELNQFKQLEQGRFCISNSKYHSHSVNQINANTYHGRDWIHLGLQQAIEPLSHRRAITSAATLRAVAFINVAQ